MCLFVDILGRKIPTYGLLIAAGVILANLIALYFIKKNQHDVWDFFTIEAYVLLGAFVGAKLLYLLVSWQTIDWTRILELEYFNQIMQGGFVFYGGLIGGLLMALGAGRWHRIDAVMYIRHYIFLIPFIHGFGRIGCFLAGCCYGRPYEGVGSVVFPEGSLAPSGVPLFPVQLLEAVILLGISILLLWVRGKRDALYTVEVYLGLYGVARFGLEYLRYDEARGHLGGLSTSQWISVGIVLVALFLGVYHCKGCAAWNARNDKYKTGG